MACEFPWEFHFKNFIKSKWKHVQNQRNFYRKYGKGLFDKMVKRFEALDLEVGNYTKCASALINNYNTLITLYLNSENKLRKFVINEKVAINKY